MLRVIIGIFILSVLIISFVGCLIYIGGVELALIPIIITLGIGFLLFLGLYLIFTGE